MASGITAKRPEGSVEGSSTQPSGGGGLISAVHIRRVGLRGLLLLRQAAGCGVNLRWPLATNFAEVRFKFSPHDPKMIR